jgi:hypothetical protein
MSPADQPPEQETMIDRGWLVGSPTHTNRHDWAFKRNENKKKVRNRKCEGTLSSPGKPCIQSSYVKRTRGQRKKKIFRKCRANASSVSESSSAFRMISHSCWISYDNTMPDRPPKRAMGCDRLATVLKSVSIQILVPGVRSASAKNKDGGLDSIRDVS